MSLSPPICQGFVIVDCPQLKDISDPYHPRYARTACKRPVANKPSTIPRIAVFVIINACEGIGVEGINARPSTINTYRNGPAQLDSIHSSQAWLSIWNGLVLPRS